LVKKYPKSDFVEKANQKKMEMRKKLAHREEYVGNFYFIRDQWLAAAGRYERLYLEFPGLGFDELALSRAAKSFAKMNQKEKARTYFQLLVERFPKHPFAAEAKE